MESGAPYGYIINYLYRPDPNMYALCIYVNVCILHFMLQLVVTHPYS